MESWLSSEWGKSCGLMQYLIWAGQSKSEEGREGYSRYVELRLFGQRMPYQKGSYKWFHLGLEVQHTYVTPACFVSSAIFQPFLGSWDQSVVTAMDERSALPTQFYSKAILLHKMGTVIVPDP